LLALLAPAPPAPSSTASTARFGLAPEPLALIWRSQYWAWRQHRYLLLLYYLAPARLPGASAITWRQHDYLAPARLPGASVITWRQHDYLVPVRLPGTSAVTWRHAQFWGQHVHPHQ